MLRLSTGGLKQVGVIRAIYQLETLEARRMLTLVALDATAGLVYDGRVATQLRLPVHATGLTAVNVMVNGQWDYAPTAVSLPDGTFDLYVNMIPQRSGTGETSIWYRNDRTGGWGLLEYGQQTVKANHFNSTVADANVNDLRNGARYTNAVATFELSDDAGPLANYKADVNWFGTILPGRFEVIDEKTVGVFVDAYLPTGSTASDVTTTIRLAADPDGPAKGFANTSMSVNGASSGIGFGMFYGVMTSPTTFAIDLPNKPKYEGSNYHFFVPVSESEGWPSTFKVEVLWQRYDDLGTTEAAVVRNPDGTHHIVGIWPPKYNTLGGMIRVKETVHRPAIGAQPAESYTIEYVGSFELGRVGHTGPLPSDPNYVAPSTPLGPNPTITLPPLAPIDEPLPVEIITNPVSRPPQIIEPDQESPRGVFAVDKPAILPGEADALSTFGFGDQSERSLARTLFSNEDDTLFGEADDRLLSVLN